MLEIRQTPEYALWFSKLRDAQAKARIDVRIRRVSLGNLGDAKFFDGIGELRIDFGSGYRIYFSQAWRRSGDPAVRRRQVDPNGRHQESQDVGREVEGRAMTLATTKWDAAEHLDSPEAIAAYIDAAMEDGDPALISAVLGDVARALGMSQIAREAGLSRESLYRALSQDGHPEFATVAKVMKAMGLRLAALPL